MLSVAAAIFLSNQMESRMAAESSQQVLQQIELQLQAVPEQDPLDSYPTDPLLEMPIFPGSSEADIDPAMTEVEINGNPYIGYLTIPGLDAPLPVMSDWSYPKLQISPCRFYGSTKSDDLVVMAHNYDKHFGKLRNLSPGDEITFTDMDNETIRYEVIATEILSPDALEDMISAAFDLTLFTCTYGGQSRVTVRCDRIEA